MSDLTRLCVDDLGHYPHDDGDYASYKQAANLIKKLQSENERLRNHFERFKTSELSKYEAERKQLQSQLSEHERLHGELAAALRHDAETPSLCDLVAVARAVANERDELAVHVERLSEAARRVCVAPFESNNPQVKTKGDFIYDLAELLCSSPTTSLAERDAQVIVKAVESCKLKVLDGPDVYSDCLIGVAETLKRRAHQAG